MLWDVAGHPSSLSKDDFFAYFSGKDRGVSIHFDRFILLPNEVPLACIKIKYPRFHPPQSYIYLSKDFESVLLCNNSDLT